jgi:hypothetical protein
MITKPRKNPMDVSSYRPITLLPIISKLLEKLLFKNINKDLNPSEWIPNHQFGFRKDHSTVRQCYRITDIINKATEKKSSFVQLHFQTSARRSINYCTQRHYSKSTEFNPQAISTSRNRASMNANSKQKAMEKLQLLLHPFRCAPMQHSWSSSLFTTHIWLTNSQRTTLDTFADDTAIFATHEDPTIASLNIQELLYSIEKYLKKWKIKFNESKSSHINFILRKRHWPCS